jgi:succinate-semialdehyde dehydrogenase/glutarate-semialdehyde dehydrogenase
MKRTTMEVGGHAPVIIFDDANLDLATTVTAMSTYRNAGQVCVAHSRLLIQKKHTIASSKN